MTDDQLKKALSLMDARFQKVVRDYLERAGETIRQLGHMTPSTINTIAQVRKMGVDCETILHELQRATVQSKEDLMKLYFKTATDEAREARERYALQSVFVDKAPLEAVAAAVWRQTAKAMDNLSNTTAISAPYRQLVDEAIQAVSSGIGDYNSEIRDKIRQFGRAGLQVKYDSGYHRRLDTAIRQNILDGTRQIQQKAREIIGEQIGADGVEISAHPHSAPDHEPVQGRMFALEEFNKMQAGEDFVDVSGKQYTGFPRPITEWHCRHLVSYVILGAAKPRYTEAQLAEWKQENQAGCVIDGEHYTTYEATQLMRQLETKIRKEKDCAVLAKATGDDVLRRDCQENITQYTLKYKEIASAAGLRPRMDKTYVEGFKPYDSAKS